jgi:hypothetical protein
MKEKILSIASDLREGHITSNEAKKLLLGLFGVSSSFGGYCSKETLEGKRCKDICDKSQCGW